jgi:hypothetical protein
MSGWSVQKTAESFDELYTRMTGLQRRLIEVARSGDESDPRTRELEEEARTVIAACEAAARAMTLGYDAREVEARALRARVLHPPLDGVLVMAAARSLARPYGYALLADALAIEHSEADSAASDVWAERSVLDLLSAPQGMGEFRAGHVADHIGLAAEALVADLDDSARKQLIVGLRQCADELPESVNSGRRQPKLPENAAGAGRDLLDRWVDESGTGTDPIRQAARKAAQRGGWPEDGVPVAELLVAFTGRTLMPHIVPGFEVLAAEPDFEQRVAAIRAEERSYRQRWRYLSETEEERQEAFDVAAALRGYVEGMRAAAKARQLVELAPEQWRSGSPLTNARTAARRCGEILAMSTEDAVELLDVLPGEGQA